MQFSEILDKEKEGIKVILFSFASFIFLNFADNYIGLKANIGETATLFIYGMVVIVAYIPLAALYEWLFVSKKITITPSQNLHSRPLPPPMKGLRYFIDLEVKIPEGWEITNCYATLDSVIPVFYQDRKLLKPEIAKWLSERTKPKDRRLLWESDYANSDCELAIKDNPKELFSIACVDIGSFKSKKETVKVNWFNFRFCKNDPVVISLKQFGLYKIKVCFHWNRKGNKMVTKIFDGYIYSEPRETIPYVIVGSGDYNKDERIPKPISEKTGEGKIIKVKKKRL